MADLVIPTGFGLWTFHLQHAGISHTALTTLGFEISATPYLQGNNDAALAAFATALQPLYDSEVTFSRLTTLVGNDGPLIRFESTGSTQGNRAAQIVTPPQTTYLVKKSTAFAGRRFRGRMYLPFVTELGTEQTGQLTSAELTVLTARVAALQTGLDDVAINVSSLRLLHSESPLSVTPAPTAISVLSASNFVATQRRRLRRS